jgi:hypothetical protein
MSNASRKFEVTITENVTYSMVVTADSAEAAEEVAEQEFLENSDRYFDQVDDREFEVREVHETTVTHVS